MCPRTPERTPRSGPAWLLTDATKRLPVAEDPYASPEDISMPGPGDASTVNAPHIERRLAAILSADVKDYSRLMGDDDVATVETLTAYRQAMTTLITRHRGRVVDSAGDSLLAEFSSVVSAVQCSVRIQRELTARNTELPPGRRMEVRIGVNLGDVLIEGDRIYGDGINVAARVQGLAEGGGVCISGSVCDEISSKLTLSYESLGEHTLKNIEEPVRVYRVRMDSATPAEPLSEPQLAEVGLQLEHNELPSVAVLPFANMSDDPQQEHFTDGLTDDIITDLAKIGGLAVVARNSVFIYKNRSVKISDVGRELGIRYVLEGSVRKVGDQVRVTAQLVDAEAGRHLWAERYDRDLNNVFAIQSELSQKITVALKEILTTGEHMDAGSKRITDKVWRSILPTGHPVKIRGSFGSGLACDGCDKTISPNQPEHEVEMPDGHIVRLHVACSGLWRVLNNDLLPDSDPVSAQVRPSRLGPPGGPPGLHD